MREAYVQLVCPACAKSWEKNPSGLPAADESFDCPECAESRRTAEFMRTDRDLENLKALG